MQPIFRALLVALLAFMFRSQLLGISRSTLHIYRVTGASNSVKSFVNTQVLPAIETNILGRNLTSSTNRKSNMSSEERPHKLIANKGLELLTFGM
jgi:hypothetical protein